MAGDQEARTEAPTPRRRSEARQRGQVARSHDLVVAVVLLAGFVGVYLFGPGLWFALLLTMRTGLTPGEPWGLEETLPFAAAVLREVFLKTLPLLLMVVLAAGAVLYAQVGPLWTWEPLTPNFNKLNPIYGLRRLASAGSLLSALTNLAKSAAVVAVAFALLSGAAASIVFAFTLGHFEMFLLGANLTFRLGLTLSVVFLLLAILDFGLQRFRHERSLRMTKEEVKDELRSMEGDPAIKRRRRQVQLQLAAQRLRRDVPQADVVVANPTHYSVAIRYDSETMAAPKVIAKGVDEVAIRIRQLAKEFGIPVVERRALARALYESVEVGHFIPERFYAAIAEILAYVYELTGRWREKRERMLAQ